MAEPPDEISCSNCVGACCRGPVNLPLTQDEYRRHRTTMNLRLLAKPRDYPQVVTTKLISAAADGSQSVVDEPLRLPRGKGLWQLIGPCGYLQDNNMCGIYETRPGCCRSFEMGSVGCINTRLVHGLDVVAGTAGPTEDEPT